MLTTGLKSKRGQVIQGSSGGMKHLTAEFSEEIPDHPTLPTYSCTVHVQPIHL